MNFRSSIPFILLSAVSCSRIVPVAENCVTEVAIQTGCGTKTHIAEDGYDVDWDSDDCLYLWAINSTGQKTLVNQEFKLYGGNRNDATFTTTLSAPMASDSYSYYAISPSPASINDPIATFIVPAVQDGRGSGIMVSEKATGPELKSAQEAYSGARLEMNQLLHLLKCSISDPENKLKGENVKSIKLTFPKNVTGQISRNIYTSSQPVQINADGNTVTINTLDGEYSYATILPVQWDENDTFSAMLYTDSRIAQTKNISLSGRNMLAGHSTPVILTPEQTGELCRLNISLGSNPLGEDLKSITLTAPSGCKWSDDGGNTLNFSDNNGIKVGSDWELVYTDGSAFLSLSGKTVTISCQSEHVQTNISYTFPNLLGVTSHDLTINVPWLLNENFDNVGSFSSYDNYSSSFNSGSKDSYSFLNGWTGGRIGASAGKCIRTACRRETSANYHARVDSAPLSGTLIKASNLKVEFSYGSDNQYGGVSFITDGNVGQNVKIGYVTSTQGYKSGDSDGTYESGNSFYTKEYTGSWTNTPNETDYTIHNAPANSIIRISWRALIESQAGTHNTTAWLYLDNIKVTIVQ